METETIKRNNFPHPAMDFFGMRNSAIDYLQQLAGEEWTDYNEHDPGVTILDQLCYAITDLSYRTNYDIRDLLAGKQEYSGRVEIPADPDNPFPRAIHKDTFFTLDEIMPCHPLTINDWRRLIIDGVDGVRNAWIEPLNENFSHPIGVYRILIEEEENHLFKPQSEKNNSNKDDQEDEHIKKIVADVRNLFHANRNLCEDLESVKVLKKREVNIIASIEVDETANSEEILAKIFFKVGEFLSHPIRRYPLNQMLEKGYSIGTIFDGPRLKNGFIPDEELYSRTTQIYYSRIIRAILDVPEVNNICDFRIEGADDEKKVLFLGDMEVPVFSMKFPGTDDYGIKLMKNNIRVYIDKNLVSSYYEAFRLGQPRPYTPGQHKQALRAFDVKLGRDRKAGEYRSVQYDFPPVYGIGEFGVGEGANEAFVAGEVGGKKRTSARRAGLAQQLKGYLLIFDQVLANYLEQLASVPTLFSIDPLIKRSYFPAMKLDVPRLEPLLKQGGVIPPHKNDGEQYSGEALHIVDHEMQRMQKSKLMFSSEFGYHEALSEITGARDDFFERRNRFLDHLLSRFGISMAARMFGDVNWYFTTEEDLHEFILESKTAALQYIDLFTERRGQAAIFTYQTATAWLESYVRLRLGIVDSKINLRLEFYKMAAPLYDFNISDRTTRVNTRKREVDHLHGKVKSEIAESDLFQPYDHPEKKEDHDAFDDQGFYEEINSHKIHIDIDMMRSGYLANNYRFGKLEGEQKVSVIYRDPEDNAAADDRSWKIIGAYENVSEAINGILSVSSFLRFLNLETEGLHLVEHLPLRPPIGDLKFETQLLDAAGLPLLHAKASFCCEEDQEEIIRKFHAAGCKADSYIIKPEGTKWLVELVDNNREVFAHSTKLYGSKLEAQAASEIMRHRCVDLFIRKYKRIEDFRFRTWYGAIEIPPLSFYSLRMTVVMPSWTARFSNVGFRKIISQLLRNYAPAHINIVEFFLEPSEMKEFEDRYEQWRKAWAENDPAAEDLGIHLSILLNKYYSEIDK